MISVSFGAVSVLVMTVLALALPVLAVWVLAHLIGAVMHVVGAVLGGVARVVAGVFGMAGGLVGRVAAFASAEVKEVLHLAGGVLTGGVIAPLAAANLAIGRLGAAGHYGRALEDELTSVGVSLYRVALGHPIRFLGLSALTDGVERRLPELVSRAPRGQTRRGSTPEFEGYKVTGTLTAGGSGARLFLARPREATVRRYQAAGQVDPGQVVIKSFALEHGSTLPQIVRESRALEAAKRLGLVLDHDLTERSFWYAMPFVPGDDLDVVTRRLHARAGAEGLDRRGLAKVVGYGCDLLSTLERFHAGGLWHKDIKPSNLIVSGDRAHLVDLGLVTPLASAMTLTTHGTEYFRDPELVRLAMKGVKVHEVDGVKFDVYSAGAVLYSMIENSFPAHGSLSRLSKRCPEALAWIVRRAMADIDQRYGSAREMATDLEVLLAAPDPFAVRPADLPSMGGPTARARRASWAPDDGSLDGEPSRGLRANDGRVDLEELVAAPAGAPLFEVPPPLPPLETDRRVRRRGRRGVLAAAAMLVLFAATFGGLLGMARHGWHGNVGWARVEGPRWPRVSVSVPSRAPAARARQTTGPVTLGELRGETGGGERVLVLTDLGLDPRDPALARLRSALRDKGWSVVAEGELDDDDHSIDLIAGARRAVELGDPGDVGARGRLQSWLDERGDVDAVLWLAPGREEGTVRQTILVRGGAPR